MPVNANKSPETTRIITRAARSKGLSERDAGRSTRPLRRAATFENGQARQPMRLSSDESAGCEDESAGLRNRCRTPAAPHSCARTSTMTRRGPQEEERSALLDMPRPRSLPIAPMAEPAKRRLPLAGEAREIDR